MSGRALGVFGGGQLGRFLAMAARHLDVGVVVLDPDAQCSAAKVVDEVIVGSFDDVACAEALAKKSTVVTIEIEKIARASLEAAAKYAPVRPSAEIVAMVQDRAAQKRWLVGRGYPLARGGEAKSADEAYAQAAALGGGAVRIKAARGGYDGRGQGKASSPNEAARVFVELAAPAVIVEEELALDAELSILVARRPSGQIAVHPAARNWHEHAILRCSVIPASLDAALTARAQEIAVDMAEAMKLEGILAVEFFASSGRVLVNELAPRPHNTFHAAELACATSQFEQHVRAVCDLPLGSTELRRPTALINLLGDLWTADGRAPAFERALEIPDVHLRLYGKEPRPGRKIGHLLAVDSTPERAVERAESAMRALRQ